MARFLGVVAAAVAALAAAGAASAAELKCKDVVDIALPHAGVTSVTSETLSDTTKACKFLVRSKPQPGVELRVEVWVPVGGAWNTHYRQIPGAAGDAGGQLLANAQHGFAGAAVSTTKGAPLAGLSEGDARDIARTLIAAVKGMPPAPEPPPPPPPSPKPTPKPKPHRPAHH